MSSASTPVPPVVPVDWPASVRIVSSRFPPVGVFDTIADAADLEALYQVEGMTNPRLRHELGQLSMVPEHRRISGPGTTPIMAAFTHPNPDGSRFSPPGGFGVYYAANDRTTAIRETVYHRQRFLRATAEPATVLEMRCYLARVTAHLHDAGAGDPAWLAPDSYAASQALAVALHASGSDGLVYPSVRHPPGRCMAVFHPDRIGPVRQGAHLYYHYDGERIRTVVEAGRTLLDD